MVLRLRASFIGMGFFIPVNVLPFANAALTLYLVKSYRRYVLSFFPRRFRSLVPFGPKTNSEVTPTNSS
jgi:hypothetical protein